MNDSPARIDPEEAAIGRPTQTARRLVEASVSPNTRRAYAGALRRLDAWLDGRELDEVTLAAYLVELHDDGRASSSAATAIAAACFRAKLAGQPTPAGVSVPASRRPGGALSATHRAGARPPPRSETVTWRSRVSGRPKERRMTSWSYWPFFRDQQHPGPAVDGSRKQPAG